MAVVGQVAEFMRLKAGFTVGYRTEHFLTNENVGNDLNDDDQVVPGEDDLNPYFCGNSTVVEGMEDDLCESKGQASYDQIGFRFKNEGHRFWSVFASMIVTL